LPGSAKFCLECGEPVAQQIAPRSPDSYTPKHLAEKILTSKAALEGERKQVTVLFADLKGSMELLADRDPEEARKLLDPVLEHMMEAVHRYEGTVNQVMGDGIMALFGAPLAHEDHAVRACYAALRMQESVKQYAEGVQRAEGIPIRIRVGLNSGEVVVRSIGSDLHMDYTAVGQTTHLAARMEQMAVPGSTLITEKTLTLAEGYIQFKPLGRMPIKGLEAPIEVYDITGAATVRSRLHAAAASGLSRFVGRQRELDQLSQAFERAATGRGQIVAVVGEAGVGKSRLYWELTHSHRTQGWLILESSSVSYGKAASYLPLLWLLRNYFQLEERDDARRVREKVAGKLLILDEGLKPAVPALLAVLDVPVDEPEWQVLDPSQRRNRTLEAVKQVLVRESQVQPLVVLCEDLHWIDTETQAVLERLVESLPTARILLLVNYRPEYQHGWGSKTYYTQLRIDPLPPETAGELLDSLLGGDASLLPLKQLLIERTEGNPFFLEESVRTLFETGVLGGPPGTCRLAKPITAIHVADTVQAMLAARIDRLEPDHKRLLQSAAVIGKDVPFPLLQALADPDYDVRRGLSQLQAAEFLYEIQLFPEVEYTFKHALTHEVAYGGVLQARRKALHAKTVEAIERLYADRTGEQAESLARHAVQGELWDKAFEYLSVAARRSAARGAFRDACDRYEQALELLPDLPPTPEMIQRGIDLRLDLSYTTYVLGQIPRFVELLQEAEQLARQLGDQRRLAEVANRRSQYCWVDARYREGIPYAWQALEVAETLGHSRLRASATYRLGAHHVLLGEHETGIGFFRRVVDRDRESATQSVGPTASPFVSSCGFLSWALALTGDFATALIYADRGVHAAETSGNPHSQAMSYTFRATVPLYQGDIRDSLPWCERCLLLCESKQVIIWLPTAHSMLGWALAVAGRPREGLPHLELGAELQERNRQKVLLSAFYLRWAQGLLLLGNLPEAKRIVKRALELAEANEERGIAADILELLGEIAAAERPTAFDAADEFFRRAKGLATELGMRPLVAHCHLGLGKLYRRTGEREQVRDHLTTAMKMYREMGMRVWLEQAEADRDT